MIKNLSDYFKPELEIFLDSLSYKRIESENKNTEKEFTLLCKDNIKTEVKGEGIRIIVTRILEFDPEEFFTLSVVFGADLKFNERKTEVKWDELNIADEFRENGDFVTAQLMSRMSLLIGQITSSFGQQPIIPPLALAKKD